MSFLHLSVIPGSSSGPLGASRLDTRLRADDAMGEEILRLLMAIEDDVIGMRDDMRAHRAKMQDLHHNVTTAVIPAQAGIQGRAGTGLVALDSRLRGNDVVGGETDR